MNKHRHSIIGILLTGLCACSLADNPGAQLWLYTESNAPSGTIVDTAIGTGSFLDLRPDGSYTRSFGRFEYGTWILKDQRLYLTNQKHKTYIYRVSELKGKKLDLMLSSTKTGNFFGYGRPVSDPGIDPFSLDNNLWRVAPTHKESNAEIRKRMYDHCRFWEVYFKWAEKEVSGTVDVRSIPTPMKIYGNGFGLKHYADLPAAWKDCFFDEEDCRRADTLIKHTFRQHNIVWPQTDNDLEKFISGFQQLQQFLR
jgi:hypothetical protein